jgi:hypothetical protein
MIVGRGIMSALESSMSAQSTGFWCLPGSSEQIVSRGDLLAPTR